MSDNASILLNRFQYCHVQDRNTGALRLVDGPTRVLLESHESILGEIRPKVVLKAAEYAVVLNPHDPGLGDLREGDWEVRRGPAVFSLHPGESLKDGVRKEHILTDRQALLIQAVRDAQHPFEPGRTLRAGERVVVRGPGRYAPDRDVKVDEVREALVLSENQGAYVQKEQTGEVRLVTGPVELLLEQDEWLWEKPLTEEEMQALGYRAQPGYDERESRALSAAPRTRTEGWQAVTVELQEREVVCLYEGERTRVVEGPGTVFLGPHERPRVLFLSGGLPVRPNVLRVASLSLGPDFLRDRLAVRTRDNAGLELEVTYRWRFLFDRSDPARPFALKDFVGFAAQVLSSEIREEAARHTFERFHSEAASLVKKALFGGASSRLFEENGLEIFGVDVESVTPEDKEIRQKLGQAIKTNVEIYSRRVQEEAELESERRLIEGRIQNEQARRSLVALELENQRTREEEQARIWASAEVVRARGEAEAVGIRAEADRQAERERLQALASVLETPGGQAYIELQRAQVLKATDKVVVPTESRLRLDVSR